MLDTFERLRYERQIMLPAFGEEGQERIKNSRVMIAGMGGLGCPAALYLAAAGVGEIMAVDFDRVEPTNLNRQILHWEEDIDRFKVDSVVDKLVRVNSRVRITAVRERLEADDLPVLISDCDLILDALDNLETRHHLNRSVVELGIPLIYGGIHGMDGMVTCVVPGKTPCLNCIFPQSSEKAPFPVLGTTPGIIALIQVTEALKYLTGMGELLMGRLLVYDGNAMRFSETEAARDPGCEVCGKLGGDS